MLKYFIQVNLGNETKNPDCRLMKLNPFSIIAQKKKLNVIGLMIIPPNDANTISYFKNINQLNSSIGLKELSMGMSADYEKAIAYGATFVRLGSVIFGKRS